MSLVFLILTNLVVYNTRLRIVSKLIQFQSNKAPIILGLVFSGLLTSGIMLGYHPLLDIISFPEAGFISGTTIRSYVSFLGYLGATLFFVYALTARLRAREYVQAGFFALAWLIVTILGSLGIIGNIGMYYLFIAFGEEVLKYSLGNVLYQRYKITVRDILIFAILSALSFSILENFIYAFNTDSISVPLGANKVLLTRGLLTSVVHVVFTGLIGLGVMYAKIHKDRSYIPGAIFGSIVLHRAYNLVMANNVILLYPIFILGAYYLFSFLMFQSDIIYKTDGIKQ